MVFVPSDSDRLLARRKQRAAAIRMSDMIARTANGNTAMYWETRQ